MRDALSDPPRTHIVDPDGRVHTAFVANNISHPLLDATGNVREHLADRGYVLLADLYRAEGPLGGYAVFCDMEAAARAGKQVAPLSDAWLPPSVVRRRSQSIVSSAWAEPPAPRQAVNR